MTWLLALTFMVASPDGGTLWLNRQPALFREQSWPEQSILEPLGRGRGRVLGLGLLRDQPLLTLAQWEKRVREQGRFSYEPEASWTFRTHAGWWILEELNSSDVSVGHTDFQIAVRPRGVVRAVAGRQLILFQADRWEPSVIPICLDEPCPLIQASAINFSLFAVCEVEGGAPPLCSDTYSVRFGTKVTLLAGPTLHIQQSEGEFLECSACAILPEVSGEVTLPIRRGPPDAGSP